jgi:hypothetical protein
MRRLSRFLTTHSLQHSTPHGRCRDELGVIADRYTPVPAGTAPASAASANSA